MDVKHVECGFADPNAENQASREECTNSKTRVIDLLDEVERHVDILKRDLLLLEEKKDTLLTTLDTIRQSDLVAQLSSDENSEVEEYTNRLIKTCTAIDIKVNTHRDQRQEEALYEVNRLIDSLVLVLHSDPQSARARCLSYVSACTGRSASCKAIEVGVEEEEEEEEAASSPQQQFIPDAIFEEIMFLCTPDDRKRVQRRLHGLLSYIEREMVPLIPPTL